MERRGFGKSGGCKTKPHQDRTAFQRVFGQYVTAVLSGFDRIRFRATLRVLYQASMMDRYLGYCGVKLQDFKSFAEDGQGKSCSVPDRSAGRAACGVLA
jgi:hypothetical protein